MQRIEFLAALGLRLEDLPAEERDEAIKYYSEYLDEVGPDGEDAAIEELGGAEKVANIIRANCGYGPQRTQPKAPKAQPELTLDETNYAAQAEAAKATAQAAPAQASTVQDGPEYAGVPVAPQPPVYGGRTQSGSAAQQTGPTYNAAQRPTAQPDNSRRILLIILAVVLIPLWCALFGVLMGIVGTLIGFLCAGIGLVVSGICAFVAAFGMIAGGLASALATMGFALVAVGLGCLMLGASVWAISTVVPLVWRGIGNLCRRIFGKGGAQNV